MRISDWSSDVCSSDLARAVHGPTVPVAFYQIGIGDECLTKSHHVRAVLLDGACRRSPIEADVIDHRSVEQRPDRSEDIPFDAVVADMEIGDRTAPEFGCEIRLGRASGRERVCKYV